jgi:arginyl-tRNA--protein-N-Asp/Glu arginylyltransferase
MRLLSTRRISPEEACPYIPTELARHEFFLAQDLSEKQLEEYLSLGFRKFGIYFFRPNCLNCKKCLPLRVDVKRFVPSKSQKRVLKKNKDIIVKYNSLTYRDEIYQLYLLHSGRQINRRWFFRYLIKGSEFCLLYL